jgi:LytS/YehU family sensor histidine kinase
MILKLNDNDLLDMLMTSDFSENMKPDDYKYLLNRWRYFYRILYSNHTTKKSDLEGEIRKLKNDINIEKNKYNDLSFKYNKLKDMINETKIRKLTLKERIRGKVNIKDDLDTKK